MAPQHRRRFTVPRRRDDDGCTIYEADALFPGPARNAYVLCRLLSDGCGGEIAIFTAVSSAEDAKSRAYREALLRAGWHHLLLHDGEPVPVPWRDREQPLQMLYEIARNYNRDPAKFAEFDRLFRERRVNRFRPLLGYQDLHTRTPSDLLRLASS